MPLLSGRIIDRSKAVRPCKTSSVMLFSISGLGHTATEKYVILRRILFVPRVGTTVLFSYISILTSAFPTFKRLWCETAYISHSCPPMVLISLVCVCMGQPSLSLLFLACALVIVHFANSVNGSLAVFFRPAFSSIRHKSCRSARHTLYRS